MKIAILIQCHKNPEQINLLLNRLNHPNIDCYIHVDKKADFIDKIIKRSNVYILPDEMRVSVEWAHFSQVVSPLNLLQMAHEKGGYDYYWLISGQDWPLRSMDEIVCFFEEHQGKNFIKYWDNINYGSYKQSNLDKRVQIYFPLCLNGRKTWQRVIKRGLVELTGGYYHTFKIFQRKQLDLKFYFGSAFWALTQETVDWIEQYLKEHEEYCRFYQDSINQDESFFHTLVMLSPYANENTDNLLYQRFQKGANSPDVLKACDLPEARKSKYLVMRKVDMDVDDAFLSV